MQRSLVFDGHISSKIVEQGADLRDIVPDSFIYPFSCVGMLRVKYPKKEKDKNMVRGTGFLIKPNLILTCAHNFYHLETRERCEDSNVKFYPALNRTDSLKNR